MPSVRTRGGIGDAAPPPALAVRHLARGLGRAAPAPRAAAAAASIDVAADVRARTITGLLVGEQSPAAERRARHPLAAHRRPRRRPLVGQRRLKCVVARAQVARARARSHRPLVEPARSAVRFQVRPDG